MSRWQTGSFIVSKCFKGRSFPLKRLFFHAKPQDALFSFYFFVVFVCLWVWRRWCQHGIFLLAWGAECEQGCIRSIPPWISTKFSTHTCFSWFAPDNLTLISWKSSFEWVSCKLIIMTQVWHKNCFKFNRWFLCCFKL